jgi:hypothetical protein
MRATFLAALLVVGLLSACRGPTCAEGSDDYNGKCLPHTTALYVACVDAKEKNLTQGIELGATLPVAANSTFKAAYTRSRTDDSTAALQFVKDCLTLAREAASGQEAAAVREVENKTSKYIGVVGQRLPAIEVEPLSLSCGAADVAASPVSCGDGVTIKSTGVAKLHITRVNVSGPNSADFLPGEECVDQWLQPAENPDQADSCTMTVQFQPSAGGERNATLVIHQNLPKPDTGTVVALAGRGSGEGNGGQEHNLTVNGSAAVAVTSSPHGIDCGDTCTATFTEGAEVTLTATYDSGGGQLTWDGCDLVDGDTCRLRLTDDRTISADLQ